MSDMKGKAMQLANPFGWCESKEEICLLGKVYIQGQIKGLIRQASKALKNLSRWTSLLEATEHLANDTISCKIDASQRENGVKSSMIALNHRDQ